jgi:hypothetical protein
MNLKEKIKIALITKSIDRRKKNTPFNESYSELYSLPQDADYSLNNSYYFSGHDQKGNSLLFRLGKRGEGANEVWFALKDDSGAIYYNKEQVFYNNDKTEEYYESNNMVNASVDCSETGEKWNFNFNGKMSKAVLDENMAAISSGQYVDVAFDGVFSASNSIFEFSRHMDTAPLARALAREKWSKNFMVNLKENHQVHYEQLGNIKGILNLSGQLKNIEIRAVRDHSYGKRNWAYMDRHIWLMALMENGEAFNISMVRYPAVNELQTGYLISKDIKVAPVCIDSVTSMDELECSGRVPDEFQYSVRMSDGRTFYVSCKKELEYIFSFNNGDYIIREGIGSFNCNGVKGRGIIEFGFNRDQTRWSRKSEEER